MIPHNIFSKRNTTTILWARVCEKGRANAGGRGQRRSRGGERKWTVVGDLKRHGRIKDQTTGIDCDWGGW
jgi:hypothetical protein